MDYGLFVDIFVAAVVFISALVAFLRGFIREVLTILGIVGASVASFVSGPLLIPLMRGWLGVVEGEEEATEKFMGLIPYPFLADALAYGTIFILVMIILSVLSHFLAEFAKNLGLGALDRTLGVIFGLGRAVIVLGLIYLPFFYLAGDSNKKEWFGNSKTHVYLEASSGWISGFLPKGAEEAVEDGAKTAEQAFDARKKFEEMGVLDRDEEEATEQDSDKSDAAPTDKGYDNNFREQMNNLIEENIDMTPDYNE
ncbi:MAG: CvpA family protein [Alphaproteobacteria bacterium]